MITHDAIVFTVGFTTGLAFLVAALIYLLNMHGGGGGMAP